MGSYSGDLGGVGWIRSLPSLAGRIGRPLKRAGSGREAFWRAGRGRKVWVDFLEGHEWSVISSGESREVGRPSRTAGRGLRPSWRAGQCQEALPECREGLGVPSRWPGLWKPSQKGREVLGVLNMGQEGLQGPPGGQGGIERPTQSAGRSWEALLFSQDWLGWPGEVLTPPIGPGGVRRPYQLARRVGKPSWRAGSDQEALPDGREGSDGPSGWMGELALPKGLGGVGSPSRWPGGVARG